MQSVTGMVTGAHERISGAIIKNLRTHDEAISDVRGLFSIKAKSGDTVITSSFNYETDTAVYHQQNYLIIQLKQTTTLLKEVIIRDSLASPLAKYDQNKKDYKEIYRLGDKSNIISIPLSIGTEIGVDIDIDKVYSALSKQGKDARRLQRNLTRDYQDDVVDQRFNKTLTKRITGYTGQKLDNFMIKYRPAFAFANKATTYDMIQYIKKKMALDLKVEE